MFNKRQQQIDQILALLVVTASVLLVHLCFQVSTATAADTADRPVSGEQLFNGDRLELTARLRGQSATLPANVVVCRNCHALEGETGRVTDQPGPSLGSGLKVKRSRYGGPAFAYRYGSFCTLLREGITPTGILTASAMPVFEISNDHCYVLWRYLIHESLTD